jgi:hypothetical protein
MLLLTESATGLASEAEELGGHEAADAMHGERRRGLRVRQHRPVKVFEPAAGRFFGGQTEDVSSTGLRIELPAWAPLRPGETLNIHVGLTARGQSLANRRHMIPARVVWVNRLAGKGARLEAGVEFLTSIAAHLDAA